MPKRVLPLIRAPLVVDHVQQIANEVISIAARARPSHDVRIVDTGVTPGFSSKLD